MKVAGGHSHKIAWAAGFIEGEGCFLMHKSTLSPQLQVTQVVVAPLGLLQKLFGGHIYKDKRRVNRRQTHCWVVSGSRAQEVCKILLPFLTFKKSQAQIVLSFKIAPNGKGRPLRLSSKERRKRLNAWETLKSIHRKAP